VPGFLNLTLVGILLAVAFHRTGALYFPIGLHASWVVWIKLYGYVSQPTAGAGTWGAARTSWWTAGWLCQCCWRRSGRCRGWHGGRRRKRDDRDPDHGQEELA